MLAEREGKEAKRHLALQTEAKVNLLAAGEGAHGDPNLSLLWPRATLTIMCTLGCLSACGTTDSGRP